MSSIDSLSSFTLASMVYSRPVKELPKLELTQEQKQIAAELGRIGGQTRAKKLSAKRRRAIALKASKAASKARRQGAKGRKAVK